MTLMNMDIVHLALLVYAILFKVMCYDVGEELPDNKYSHYNVHHSNMCPPNGYRPVLAMDFRTVYINNTSGDQTKIVDKVTVVNEVGDIVYDCFVKNSNLSDVPEKGEEFLKVGKKLANIIQCRLLVGHNLYKCLHFFKIHHPQYLLRDTTYFSDTYENATHTHDSLKIIAKEFLGMDIEQNFHNTYENAIIAMKIYKKYQREWEIYNLEQHNTAFALDCEMVESERVFVGPNKTVKIRVEEVVRASVVDHLGGVVYDKLIKPELPVTDYRTFITGVNRKNLTHAANLTVERERLESLLRGHILVGHAIWHDLSLLGINHPIPLCRDSSKFVTFLRKYPHKRRPSLKELAKDLLNMTIQEGHHSSIEDAHAAMMLYLKYRQDWDEDVMKMM